MGLLSGGDDVNIQVKMQGAREAAAEGKMVSESVDGMGAASTRAGTAAAASSKKVSLARKGFAAMAVAAKWAAVAVGAAAVAFTYKGIRAAVDLGEQINKASVVFGKSSLEMIRWSEETGRTLGISQREALEFAGVFGNMLVPMGIAEKKAASMSEGLVTLAADMASFNNATPEEVLEALRAGLAGETEPLRRFGVFLSADRVALEAKKKGMSENYQELTAGQKALVGYNIILKDTKKAHGDFARTSTSLANQERILKAVIEDIAAKFGKNFLPILTKVALFVSTFLVDMEKGRGVGGKFASIMGDVGKFLGMVFSKVKKGVVWFWDLIGGLDGIVGAAMAVKEWTVGAFNAFMSAVRDTVQWVTTAANNVVGFVLALKPVQVALGLIKVGIFALVIAFKLLWPVIQLAAYTLGKVLSAAVQVGIGAIKIIWQIIKTFAGAFANIVGIITSLLRGDFAGAWRNAKQLVTGVVSGILSVVKITFQTIFGVFGTFVSYIKGLPGKLLNVGKGMFDFLKTAFKTAINWVIEKWNSLEFKIPEIDPPGPGPTFGGFTIGVPDIPKLAAGGTVMSAGLSLIGERGPEILRLPRGARVEPLVSPRLSGGGDVSPVFGEGGPNAGRPIVVHSHLHVGGREIAEAVTEVSEDEQARR